MLSNAFLHAASTKHDSQPFCLLVMLRCNPVYQHHASCRGDGCCLFALFNQAFSEWRDVMCVLMSAVCCLIATCPSCRGHQPADCK